MSKESRTLIIALIFSVIFHVVLLFYSNKYAEKKKEALAELREVELLEEKVGPRVNPKVLKMLAEKKAEKEKPEEPPSGGPTLDLTRKKVGLGVEKVEGPKISLDKSIEEPQIQGPSISLDQASSTPNIENAQIDLSATSGNVDVEGADVVLAFSGKGKSTSEILKEQPVSGGISLERSGMSDAGGGLGIGGTGNGTGGKIKLVSSGGTSLKDLEQETPTISSAVKKRPSISLRQGKTSKKSKRPLISLSGPLQNRKILKKIAPIYPRSALREGEEGTCVLKFWVSRDGKVKPNILILRSTGYPDLDRAAMQALRMWVFEPSSRDDDWGVLTVVFQLL